MWTEAVSWRSTGRSFLSLCYHQDDGYHLQHVWGKSASNKWTTTAWNWSREKCSWRGKKITQQTWWKHISLPMYKTGIIWVSSQVLSSFNAALILFKSLLCWKTSSQLAKGWDFRYLYLLRWAATTARKILMLREVQAHLLWATPAVTSVSAQLSCFS